MTNEELNKNEMHTLQLLRNTKMFLKSQFVCTESGSKHSLNEEEELLDMDLN